MRSFFYVFIITTTFCCNAFSQSVIVKQNGWKIPDTRILRLKNEEAKIIDEISINEQVFAISDKKLTIFVNTTKNLKIKTTRFWEVYNAKSYSRRNKIFAYQFSYVPFIISEYRVKKNTKVKTKYYLALILSFYYVDNDGDGVFEIRYSAYKTELKLPNWVKNIK